MRRLLVVERTEPAAVAEQGCTWLYAMMRTSAGGIDLEWMDRRQGGLDALPVDRELAPSATRALRGVPMRQSRAPSDYDTTLTAIFKTGHSIAKGKERGRVLVLAHIW